MEGKGGLCERVSVVLIGGGLFVDRLETVELLVRTHPELIQQMRRAFPDQFFSHTPLHLASRNGHK